MADRTLVAGTEQFGPLGFGMQRMDQAVPSDLRPYPEAVDDPSTAGDPVNPDDVATLAGNAPAAAQAAASFFEAATPVTDVLVEMVAGP